MTFLLLTLIFNVNRPLFHRRKGDRNGTRTLGRSARVFLGTSPDAGGDTFYDLVTSPVRPVPLPDGAGTLHLHVGP